MPALLNLGNWLLPLLYLALLIDYGAGFFLRTRSQGRNAFLAGVVAVHVAWLVGLGVHLHRLVPVNSPEVLSALAAATAAVYLVVEFLTRERRTGAFVLLAVFALQYTSSVLLPRVDLAGPAPSAPGSAGGVHIIPSVVAYTGLTLAAIYGLLHLLAQRGLRRHRFGLLFDRLPPLETLGLMNWHAMLMGFAFLSAAIATGAWMFTGPGGRGSLEGQTLVKIVVGSAAWVVYATAVAGKWLGRWKASRICWISVVGFVLVLAMLAASTVLA